jgi:hypothetical protein
MSFAGKWMELQTNHAEQNKPSLKGEISHGPHL